MKLDDLKSLSQDEQFQAVSKWSGIPVSDLKGVYKVESSSGTDPNAFKEGVHGPTSTALGHFQITNTTLRGIEKQTGIKLDRNDFTESLWGAGYVLKQNMAAFQGDVNLALGAFKEGTAEGAARNAEAVKYVAKVRGGTAPAAVPEDEFFTNANLNRDTLRAIGNAYTLTSDNLMNTRARDLRMQAAMTSTKGADENVPGFQKRAADLAAGKLALNALDAGEPTVPDQAMRVMRAGVQALPPEQVGRAMTPAPVQPDLDASNLVEDINQQHAAAAEAERKAQSVTFVQQAEAAFENQAVIKQLSSLAESDAKRSALWDENYKFGPDQLKEARQSPHNWTQDELEHLREATSAADYSRIEQEILHRRENDYKIGARGMARSLMASGLAGIADPAGWVAGFAAGKVTQIALGARASVLARAGFAAVENTAQNVALTGLLDASGGYVSRDDYLMAAVMGAALGGTFGAAGAGVDESLKAIGRGVTDYNVELTAQALRRVGPDATPDQLQQAMRDIEVEAQAARQERDALILAPVRDEQRLFPDAGQSAEAGATGGDPTNPFLIGENTPLRTDIEQRHGLDSTTDEGERRMAAEMLARSERWLKSNPINPDKAKSVLTKLGSVGQWLESTGVRMARSKNPIMQWAAGNLSEVTTGAAGRQRTASILKQQLEDHGRAMWGDFNANFDAWYRHQKISDWRAFSDDQVRAAFDRQVAREINIRRFSTAGDDARRVVDPFVKDAADAWERSMTRFREWQQQVRSVGHEALGTNSRGYMPQKLNAQKIMEWQAAGKISALEHWFGQQFVDQLGFDQDAALKTARHYLGYVKTRANGGIDVPGNINDPDMADALEGALTKAGVYSQKAIDEMIDRFQRGSAGFTKARKLDLDLSGHILDPKTNEYVPIMEFYDTDMSKLYQSYMGRVTGEVALAQFGVYGKPGVKQMRKAMEQGVNAATPEELEVFDEFIGDLLGNRSRHENNPGLSNAMKNARALASMRYLGGMALTQAAEMVNMVHHLGFDSFMKSVPVLRNAFEEVRAGGGSKLVDQIEVYGGYLDADARFYFPFEEAGQVRLYGHDTPGIVSKLARSAGRGFQKVSGHRAVHKYQMKMAVEQIGVKALRAARNGDAPKGLLADMGFTPEKLEMIRKELPNIATFDAKGNLRDLDFSKAQNAEVVAEFITATQRGARQIIQGHFRGESGQYATSELGRLLTQFRSFSITSAEKQWRRASVNLGAATAGLALMGQMSMAIPIHLAKVNLLAQGKSHSEKEEYLKEQLNPIAFSRALVNYSSLSGVVDTPLDAVMGVASALGVEAGDNAKIGARGVATFNPVLGLADGVVRSGSRFLYNPTGDNAVAFGRSALPGGNLPYLVPMFNIMAD